jgi:hypothetical protein
MMRLIACIFFLALTFQVSASTPPAAQLLPADTLALFSVPDWDKAVSYWNDSAYGKLWQDPALKKFKEKLVQRWKEEFASPLERELGVKLADYLDLLHGQVSFALTQNGWGTRPDAKPGFVLLIDSKGKQDALKAHLTELRKKWVDAGKQLKIDTIRGVEFTTLIISDEELSKTLDKLFPAPADENDDVEPAPKTEAAKSAAKTEITFGQSGPLLIVGNSSGDIERVLARQSGGLAPALAEQAGYEANQAALFREALAFAWLNFARIYETFEKQLTESGNPQKTDNPFAVRTDKVLAASGLGGLKTVAARVSGNVEGASAEVFLGIPEARRKGIFRLLSLPRKEAGPPPFVAADVVKFSRWRLDGQRAWTTLENMLTSISPELAGLLQIGIQTAGKERDPDFDLRKALVGNLGDDFISLQKNPKSSSLSDLSAPPSLYLVGSAGPEQLVQGMKAATGLIPLAGGEPDVKEREFLGRKIYSLALSPGSAGDEPKGMTTGPRQFNFAASAGYAAMSTDISAVEEYLRGAEASGRSLREMPSLSDAAQKVGGMSTGFFGYQNQAETVRIWIESAKKERAALDRLLSLAPLAGGKVISPEERRNMKEWFDASLLPSFDRIAQYFHFLVYSLSSSEDGLSWKLFAPSPPLLK